MKKLLVLSIIISSLSLVSQVNLITNSGFEQFSSCPNFGAQWNFCNNWNNINMNTGVGFFGTPDYFNTCGTNNTAPPATFSGTCAAQSGNAMMGLVLYNVPYPEYREYLSTPLTCAMQPGTTYTLSFWLSNGTGVISPWTIKNIGVHFSASPLSQTGFNYINVVPQCEITTNVASNSWTQYTFTVNPTAVWNYLNFGSFRNDASNTPIQSFPNPGGPPSSYAHYFVDEIKVLSPGTGIINITSNAGAVLCSGNSATLSVNGAGTYTWNTSAIGSSIVVTPSVTTTYIVYTNNGSCGTSSAAITVSVSEAEGPIVSIQGPTKSICKGQSAVLTASGAATYSWNSGQTTAGISVSPTVTTTYTVSGFNTQGCMNKSVFTVSVNLCQGLSDHQTASQIKVYPNPVANILSLEFEDQKTVSELQIHNSIGERLYSIDRISFESLLDQNKLSLDLNFLSPGIYLLQIKSSDSTYFYKVIKQ